MKRITTSVLGVFLLATAVVLAPKTVLAEDVVSIQGTFVVSYMYPSAIDYCASGGIPIGAQGIGSVSRLGPMFLTVKKCLTFPNGGSVGTFAGTFKMTAGNGDTLQGTYAGTQDFSLRDENGFGPSQGTFTVTAGTGRFRHSRGGFSWTGLARPVSVDSATSTVNGTAFYLVQGNMLSREKSRNNDND